MAKIQAELLRHPEATWIRSPYTYTHHARRRARARLAVGKIDVMGGEGFEPELDLLRDGKITAVNIFVVGLGGWAAIDTMNSVFRKTPPVDSGLGWVDGRRGAQRAGLGPVRPPTDYRVPVPKGLGRP